MKARILITAAITVCALLIFTGIETEDRKTWLMEVTPVLIAFPILVFTYRRFPLTTLLYVLIWLHSIILIVGGFYTYAHVPFGFWLQKTFALSRNPYDRIGHFFQGFVPALIAREVFIRNRSVNGKGMIFFLSLCVVMTISAGYELFEWAAAISLGQGADEFLGTQGDQWDTQSDMFLALVGALIALVVLARIQNRQIAQRNELPVKSNCES